MLKQYTNSNWLKDYKRNLDLSNIQSKGYVFQIEMAAKLFNLNKRITEVPITFTERSSGKSKMTSEIALEAFIWCTKARFKRK